MENNLRSASFASARTSSLGRDSARRFARAALVWTALSAAPRPTAAQPARAPIDTTWRRGGVCYEIFVRSFFDSDGDGIGDLAGLTQKLDYVNDGNPR